MFFFIFYIHKIKHLNLYSKYEKKTPNILIFDFFFFCKKENIFIRILFFFIRMTRYIFFEFFSPESFSIRIHLSPPHDTHPTFLFLNFFFFLSSKMTWAIRNWTFRHAINSFKIFFKFSTNVTKKFDYILLFVNFCS